MKTHTKIALKYRYMVVNISENGDTGFKSIIPKFPNIWIVADNPQQLHEVVQVAIEEEIERLKKEDQPIPEPDEDEDCTYSGRFVMRIPPELHERLADLANATGTSLNQYLNRLIVEKIGQ